jgi:hypothetical protein
MKKFKFDLMALAVIASIVVCGVIIYYAYRYEAAYDTAMNIPADEYADISEYLGTSSVLKIADYYNDNLKNKK